MQKCKRADSFCPFVTYRLPNSRVNRRTTIRWRWKYQRRFQQPKNPYIFAGDAPSRPIAHPKKAFARIKKAAGITDNFRIHDLRHSFASILINSGNATLYDVQHLLGHQSPQTSIRYAHLASSRLREVSANVE